MAQNYDIAIIGGGIIGNSIAAHLADENLKVAVINSSETGIPASQAAAGLLTPFQLSEMENHFIKEFCCKSFEYFLNFQDQISKSCGVDLGFSQTGSLYLIFSNLEFGQKENEIKELKNMASPKITFINKQDIPKLEPSITKEALSAYYYHEEALINNPKFVKAITEYCIQKRTNYINSEVKEINISKSKIENIVLKNNELIQAKKYVLCNGVWANHFLKKLFGTNEDLIKAIKGEIIQIQLNNGFVPLEKIIFCKEGYILPRQATNQYETSSMLIGSTSEEINMEKSQNPFYNSVQGVSELLSLFHKIFPSNKDFVISKMWSGLRPKTKDSLPVIGQTEEFENLILALGHYRNGILMGPYTGKLISELIINNQTEYDIKPFKFERLFKSFSEIKTKQHLMTNH